MDKKILSRYNSEQGADSYLTKFERSWFERVNNRNEQRLLRKLFSGLTNGACGGSIERALDMPCGCGRLLPLLQETAPEVVESDYSEYMLRNARRIHEASGFAASEYVRSNALQTQFPDRAFDLVLSVRLCHHIHEHEERIQYLREIMRVSDCWVVFTYADSDTPKNRIREIKRKVSSKRPKWTLNMEEVKQAAEGQGFRVFDSVFLARLFSMHRYTVLQRIDR